MKDPIVVMRQKEMELARVRREVEALQIVVPLLDDPTERLPDLISSQQLAVPSEPGSLTDLEIYYPFVKNLRLADKHEGTRRKRFRIKSFVQLCVLRDS